ncbi:hypothetical protein AZI86_10580 [Bdellovibrio bacteriovorus]|uniref:Uncharacterized protein n=1 Tax=Bdellovibrio bacteriovorus TaxID=959 RepID=A0A150WL80_BDEBC|nr:hypothetical protein [Bdellovibrio bacteriovorus]KYG64652.1 hypothetical protein AZI86_10580 [Bdellovibrio bacteriovorus]
MKLLLSDGPKIEINDKDSFTCFEVNKKNSLSEPAEISKTEVLRLLAEGEEFHTLYRVGCTWEIGDKLDWG